MLMANTMRIPSLMQTPRRWLFVILLAQVLSVFSLAGLSGCTNSRLSDLRAAAVGGVFDIDQIAEFGAVSPPKNAPGPEKYRLRQRGFPSSRS